MADDQTAEAQGQGNIIVQAKGSNIAVNVHGLPHLRLISPQSRRARITKRTGDAIDLTVLNAYTRSIPLVGRDEDLASLEEWLRSGRDIAVRTMIGRAGAGKTRLAIELAETLGEAGEWDAGFVTGDELTEFPQRGDLGSWGWQNPTLIVVDYAAALLEPLFRWLRDLADRPKKNGAPPLRLLLVEREATSRGILTRRARRTPRVGECPTRRAGRGRSSR